MADILLVHGSCHGAWCWEAVLPELAALGHRARAIDLPGHGADTTPAAEVTLAGYADAILAALDGPSVLVGHSMGGYPITAAAEADRSGHVARLIYLCAYVPRPGLSLAALRRAAPRQPLLPAVRLAEDRATFTIDPGMARDVFYLDVPPDTAARATARLCPQPVPPQETALPTTARAEALPRRYILCEADGAVPTEFQEEMTADWPAGTVARMATSHSPFLSDPRGLARHVARMAED